jgi:hypothetical protein
MTLLYLLFFAYFGYMISVVGLALSLCICSYSACLDDHWMGGGCHVDMVSRWYLLANAPYMLGHVVDRGCDNNLIESYVVHSKKWTSRTRSPRVVLL